MRIAVPLTIVILVIIPILVLVISKTQGSATDRVRRHSHYFVLTTPAGKPIPCVAYQDDITCDFSRVP